jgi:hypothetical protein
LFVCWLVGWFVDVFAGLFTLLVMRLWQQHAIAPSGMIPLSVLPIHLAFRMVPNLDNLYVTEYVPISDNIYGTCTTRGTRKVKETRCIVVHTLLQKTGHIYSRTESNRHRASPNRGPGSTRILIPNQGVGRMA